MCDEVLLELVLRVEASLPDTEVLEALASHCGPVKSVTRFRRTRRGEPRPLPLCRVCCAERAQYERLMHEPLRIRGRDCPAELPRTKSGSAAALGKLLTPPAEILSFLEATHAASRLCRIPLEGEGAPRPGELAFVSRGRFHRGQRTTLTAADVEAAARGSQSIWPIVGKAASRDEPPRVLVCAETDMYHRCARAEVEASDLVLEIGCDLGSCCELAARSCGASRVLGVDLAELSVRRSRESYPAIRFEVLDALQVGAPDTLRRWAAKMRADGDADDAGEGGGGGPPFDVVLIDINGNRGLSPVARVLRVALEELRPPLVVVKSRALYERAARPAA